MKTLFVYPFAFFCLLATNGFSKSDSTRVTGRVSHMYKKGGCATVIIVESKPAVTLVPKDKLPKDFDKDGLQISFHYRKLRMPTPKGCTGGIPADITGIEKAK